MLERVRAVFGAIEGVADAHGSASVAVEKAINDCVAVVRGMDREGAWSDACDTVQRNCQAEIDRLSVAENELKGAVNQGACDLRAADASAASYFNV